jgi:hypothetical protein
MEMAEAQVKGYQIIGNGWLAFSAAARAEGSKAAFTKATELIVQNLMESSTKRLEIAMLYGQDGLGKCLATTIVDIDGTHNWVVFSKVSFAAGIWCGTKNAKLNFYDESGDLVSSGSDSIFVVDKVDIENHRIRVEGTAQGIIDLETKNDTEDVDAYFYGSYGKEMAGLKKIMTNEGELFEIDADDYDLWKSNVYTASGDISFGTVLAAIGRAVDRGLDEKVVVLINPNIWPVLADELTALRMFDSSYKSKEGEIGVESLKYHGQNGEIEIISHNCVKQGDCFIFPPKRVRRIGSTDITFSAPGSSDGKVFAKHPTKTAFILQTYLDQSVFLETPAKAVYMSGFNVA